MHPFTNRLIHESSPYLLQHAHNPVDWYPWGEEAFEKARREDKPVLVSIGYAACHWCHVMERESFEDPEVARIMNEHFVNIKVDREERPDVDHIYMDALQAMEGQGGWPLNMFLTPDRKPFYGGTYFPPRRAFNRASWTEVLLAVSGAFRERRSEIETQASQLTQHLQVSNDFGKNLSPKNVFELSGINEAFNNIMKTADREWGGFGRAPKFPQTFTISFLMQYGHLQNNSEALGQALLSLNRMTEGGIYDQIGGGFARYATDNEWLVPHFEKMLYDNALLVGSLSEAYQLTRDAYYRGIIEETLGFVERELSHPEGGFYSALDADSEGEEGKYYVWEYEEVKEVLGEAAALFCEFYDIAPRGNWEGRNIPRIRKPLKAFASEKNVDAEELRSSLREGKAALLKKREERVRPQLDDKVLLSWNALMNIAFCKAFAATGNQAYRERAEANMDFLLKAFSREGGFHHTWKNGQASQPAFLDDYSYLIAALIELAQVTAGYHFLDKAAALTEQVIELYGDPVSPFFFFTHKNQMDVPVRKKEIYDGATPSGNAVMAYNLYRLSILLDKPAWRERAADMLNALGEVVTRYPTSFGVWLSLLFEMISGTDEIAIIGNEWKIYLEKILSIYISHKLAQASANPLPRYPLLADKPKTDKIQIYLCKNYACRQPVATIQEFVKILGHK